MVTAPLPWLHMWCSVHLKKCHQKALLYIGWTIGCFNYSEDREYNFIYLCPALLLKNVKIFVRTRPNLSGQLLTKVFFRKLTHQVDRAVNYSS